MANDNRPVITSLGKARYINLFGSRNVKNKDEVFFSIEKKDKNGGFKHHGYGYMKINEDMKRFMDSLIQDRKENMSVSCIEWPDSYNIVFEDGVHISNVMCKMNKPDFESWESEIRAVH